MDPTIQAALIGGAATIIASVITGILAWNAGGISLRKKIDDAPRKYVNRLECLIHDALLGGAKNAAINARVIVSVRNDLRESMERISRLLNSDIDRLAEEISLADDLPNNRSKGHSASSIIFQTIQVLEKKWPAKKDEVEIELRKLLAELGLPVNVH